MWPQRLLLSLDTMDFYSHISTRCDLCGYRWRVFNRISTHTSLRDVTLCLREPCGGGSQFLLTHLYEMWHSSAGCGRLPHPEFLLTHLYEMWLIWLMKTETLEQFLLTHLYEMWQITQTLKRSPQKFLLTHLYEMWPGSCRSCSWCCDISTHTSLRDVTRNIAFAAYFI